jgi:hypothetical protein
VNILISTAGAAIEAAVSIEEPLAGRRPGARGLKDLLSGRERHVGSLAAFSVPLEPYEIAVLRVG